MAVKTFEIWQDGAGMWKVSHPEVGTAYNQWNFQANIFGYDNDNLAQWIHMLQQEYKCDEIRLLGGRNYDYVLTNSWSNYADANKYKLALNKRFKQFIAKR